MRVTLGASFLISCFLICQATLVIAGRIVPTARRYDPMVRSTSRNTFSSRHPIGILKRPLEQGFCHFKSDEAFVCSGGVAALGGLKDIKSELRLGVGMRIVGIRYQLSEFPAKLRVEHRNGPVDGHGVAIIIGGIMRQCSQSESVLIQGLGSRGSG